MKKTYLFAGAVALFAGVALTSCSHDFDDEGSAGVDPVVEKYNRIFIETFGQPAPNQDWGFGDSGTEAARRMTRSNPGTTVAQTAANINANANEWADVSNSTGFGGWLVPDPLTEGQKLRVQKYFQANPNLSYIDPHYRHFFIQQVYKGGPTTAGTNSTEVVTAAGGHEYTSNNMNLLTVGQSAIHIYNFNYGDGSETNVLDNEANISNHTGETYHKDKIMLMVNIDDTSCFGYHETGSSNETTGPTGQHNDRMALVSASVIDAWATTHGNPGEPVVDKWNRSFIGFDLAIKEGEQIWSGEVQSYTSGMNMGYDGLYYGEDNILLFDIGENYSKVMPNNMEDVMKDANDDPLKLLVSNTNFYSGDLVSLTDADLRVDRDGKVLVNMVKVNQLIAAGYYPVSGSSFRSWVIPRKSYDKYYSDWIVTLSKAERVDEPREPEEPDTWGEWKRIICEDLSVTQASDFDFNDVVFDVRLNTAHTKAQVKFLAAGGTLPLTVGWDGQGTNWNDYEVHNIFGVSTGTMVNTNWRTGVTKSYVTKTFTGSFSTYDDVKIMVLKGEKWELITAHTGWPASKILVNTTYQWCDERKDIGIKYNSVTSGCPKSFRDYVKDPSVKSDWYEKSGSQPYY